MRTPCHDLSDELAELVDGDGDAIARHAEHLASCDDCRDARHEATGVAAMLGDAGGDHVAPVDLVERVLAAIDARSGAAAGAVPASANDRGPASDAGGGAAPAPGAVPAKPEPAPPDRVMQPVTPLATRRRSRWLAAGAAAAAVAAGTIGIYAAQRAGTSSPTERPSLDGDSIGRVSSIERAAADRAGGVAVRIGNDWRALVRGAPLPTGAALRTDDRTRVALELADGTKLVLDHRTELAFDRDEPRRISLTGGRIVADVAHVDRRPAAIATPMGTIDVVGTRFAVTASDGVTTVQVVRGAVQISDKSGKREEVRAGEEGLIEGRSLSVSAAPGLHREVEWSELGKPARADATGAGLGALRAYKPGEHRDRDWNLALAKHDVKVRIVGPVARTEITETFRNDSAQVLEGVYQFPLPADAQIDGLSLDVDGNMVEGAFVDKGRAGKIWRGVIDKATPKRIDQPMTQEIIWVDGSWKDPALLDWKRGGRFELRVYPIPAKGQRTIKLSYTQVVTPRGPWRQYVYPLPHSTDGSTVADQFDVDLEVRGAAPGLVRAAGYDLRPDPARSDVNALALHQGGFVPRGDLVIDYRAADGDAELRAWSFGGGVAVAPDARLAAKKNVGIDPKIVDAQRAEAADTRPTAVLALRPNLPRWRAGTPRDYVIVVDASQSMVGERYTRASQLAAAMVDEMDRRDRFAVMTCDSDCRRFGDMRTPSAGASTEVASWLAAQPPAGASDVVAAVRTAAGDLQRGGDRELWVVYVGDGFATTGFRRAADIERAIADRAGTEIRVSTVGIGGDADATVLAAVARAGGGSYLAWVPGQSVDTAAVAALESTSGSALRDATIELPAGLTDVAPTTLPTLRAGEEMLIAARITGEIAGDVVVKGTVAGQPFEQRYPLKLAVSSAAGNGFVPRLWASLAIEQLERAGLGADRARIVALSQAYGVMSRETSLLVLESAAMFDAFGVDRRTPESKWTGEDALQEVVASGAVPVANKPGDLASVSTKDAKAAPVAATRADGDFTMALGNAGGARAPAARKAPMMDGFRDEEQRPGMIAMRRTWVKVPSVSPYGTVTDAIRRAVAASEAALARSPDSRERHRNLVQALAYAGELDRARAVAARWLDRDKLDPQALGYQADLLGRDGQRELALRTLAGLVDLDPDRPALHERMVRAYDNAGRTAQACSHRIALAAIAFKDARLAAGAVRCLRSVGRDRDAELILRALPDDATRSAAEKAATVAPAPAKTTGDLVVDATWSGSADLDISLVTPEGTRVSWMGGRSDVVAADVTSLTHEQLVVRTLKRGNYLVEVSRSGAAGAGVIRGKLELAVLGTRSSLPFELAGDRAVVGRVAIALEERVEEISATGVRVGFGNIAHPTLRRIMLARTEDVKRCFTGATGTMMLAIMIDRNGQTRTRAAAGGGLAPSARCVEQTLASMHVEGSAPQTLRVPLTFR